MTQMVLSLEGCLSEKQLAQLNKRDLTRLKQLAKQILEERSVIKRKEDMEGQHDPDDGAYVLEIMQENEQPISQFSQDAMGQSQRSEMEVLSSEEGLKADTDAQADPPLNDI